MTSLDRVIATQKSEWVSFNEDTALPDDLQGAESKLLPAPPPASQRTNEEKEADRSRIHPPETQKGDASSWVRNSTVTMQILLGLVAPVNSTVTMKILLGLDAPGNSTVTKQILLGLVAPGNSTVTMKIQLDLVAPGNSILLGLDAPGNSTVTKQILLGLVAPGNSTVTMQILLGLVASGNSILLGLRVPGNSTVTMKILLGLVAPGNSTVTMKILLGLVAPGNSTVTMKILLGLVAPGNSTVTMKILLGLVAPGNSTVTMKILLGLVAPGNSTVTMKILLGLVAPGNCTVTKQILLGLVAPGNSTVTMKILLGLDAPGNCTVTKQILLGLVAPGNSTVTMQILLGLVAPGNNTVTKQILLGLIAPGNSTVIMKILLGLDAPGNSTVTKQILLGLVAPGNSTVTMKILLGLVAPGNCTVTMKILLGPDAPGNCTVTMKILLGLDAPGNCTVTKQILLGLVAPGNSTVTMQILLGLVAPGNSTVTMQILLGLVAPGNSTVTMKILLGLDAPGNSTVTKQILLGLVAPGNSTVTKQILLVLVATGLVATGNSTVTKQILLGLVATGNGTVTKQILLGLVAPGNSTVTKQIQLGLVAPGNCTVTKKIQLGLVAPGNSTVTMKILLGLVAPGNSTVTMQIQLGLDAPGNSTVTMNILLGLVAPGNSTVTKKIQLGLVAPGNSTVTMKILLGLVAPGNSTVTMNILLGLVAPGNSTVTMQILLGLVAPGNSTVTMQIQLGLVAPDSPSRTESWRSPGRSPRRRPPLPSQSSSEANYEESSTSMGASTRAEDDASGTGSADNVSFPDDDELDMESIGWPASACPVNGHNDPATQSRFPSWVTFEDEVFSPSPGESPRKSVDSPRSPSTPDIVSRPVGALKKRERPKSSLVDLNRSQRINFSSLHRQLSLNSTPTKAPNPFLDDALKDVQPSPTINPFSSWFEEQEKRSQRSSVSSGPSSSQRNSISLLAEELDTDQFEDYRKKVLQTDAVEQLKQIRIDDPDSPGSPSIPDDSLTCDEPLGPCLAFTKPQPKEGWPMMLRIPEKKNIMSSRHWGPIYVKVTEAGFLQLFYEKGLEKPFREFKLEVNHEISDPKLQTYDENGRVHTVRIDRVSYKEKRKYQPMPLVSHTGEREQVIKLGTTDYSDFISMISIVQDILFHLPATVDLSTVNQNYNEEEITVDVKDEFRGIVGKGEGHLLKHSVVTHVHVLSFISGMADCQLGLNDILIKGNEVVSRHDIIPTTTTKFVRFHECQFHSSVDEEAFRSSRMVVFTPLDACRFELMRCRTLFSEKSLPFTLRTMACVRGAEVELQSWLVMSSGFSSNKDSLSQVPCENIMIRHPVPPEWVNYFRRDSMLGERSLKAKVNREASFGSPTLSNSEPAMRVTLGTAKYEHAYNAIVWRINRLPDKNSGWGHPHCFYCRLELGSDREVPQTFARYVEVEYHMPATSASKITVRSISVEERTGTKKWVNYSAHYHYKVEIEQKKTLNPDLEEEKLENPIECIAQ
ncbi:stonin-2 [Gastrophryne carolinensis]